MRTKGSKNSKYTLSAKALAARKRNILKSNGRPKATHTIETEAVRRYIIGRIYDDITPIMNMLLAKAKKGNQWAVHEVIDFVKRTNIDVSVGDLPYTVIIKKAEPNANQTKD